MMLGMPLAGANFARNLPQLPAARRDTGHRCLTFAAADLPHYVLQWPPCLGGGGRQTMALFRPSAQIKLMVRRTGPIRRVWPASCCSSAHGSNDPPLSRSVRSFQADTWTSIMADAHIRALTARHQIMPISPRCPSAWQPKPGRRPTYRRGKSVQTTETTYDLAAVTRNAADVSWR